MITIIKNTADKDDLVDCIEEIYNYLLNTYEQLSKVENYLNSDIANRKKYEQPYENTEDELKKVSVRCIQLSEIIDEFKDSIDNNNIEIKEEK